MAPVGDERSRDGGTAPSGAGPRGYPRRAVLGAAAGLALGAAGCAAPGGQAPARSAAGARTPTDHPTGPPSDHPSTHPSVQPTDATPDRTPPSVAVTDGPDVVHGPRDRAEVALTFHGQGPAALTARVLRECRRASAPVTVFAVGTWLAADPETGRALLRAGHELGNHTWSHQQMPLLGAAAATREVARGAAALRDAVGSPGWWFRPSGTRHSTATIRAAARASGYRRCVSYDVDPADYLDPGADLVRSRTRRQVRPGSIVSLHLGHPGTADALPGILADLAAVGLAPVTLSTLLRDGA